MSWFNGMFKYNPRFSTDVLQDFDIKCVFRGEILAVAEKVYTRETNELFQPLNVVGLKNLTETSGIFRKPSVRNVKSKKFPCRD